MTTEDERRGAAFSVCQPDQRRAKGLHRGGCPHPTFCIAKGECYYGNELSKPKAEKGRG